MLRLKLKTDPNIVSEPTQPIDTTLRDSTASWESSTVTEKLLGCQNDKHAAIPGVVLDLFLFVSKLDHLDRELLAQG